MGIKEKFPTEETLRLYINEHASLYTSEIFAQIGYLEKDYKKAVKNQILGIGLIVIGSITFPLLEYLSSVIEAIFALAIGFYLIFQGLKIMGNSAEVIANFNNKLNELAFNKVFKIFSVSGIRDVPAEAIDPSSTVYKINKISSLFSRLNLSSNNNKVSAEQVTNLLNQSELITEARNKIDVDDTFSLTLDEKELVVSELDVKNETGSGKNRHVKNIFHGYLFAMKLEKQLEGKTFVSAESDKSGFGDKSFFGSSKGMEETILEWNEFEEKLHVMTSHPVEARYILTTNFMSDLYNWWKDRKQKIRLSFIGSSLYILYPDTKIRLNRTVSKITEEEIVEYLESISVPLLNVLYLVDDVK
ncbi:DUF3137 domain-containing protein [Candidatus Nomurabacteria bacterium]|nr:DUF3137 domain-containing protein [Candidatus Nomurabacteria bacterium]